MIKRFFECLIPVTICNLECEYCYVIQRKYRNMKKADLKYTPREIGMALTKERLGGICYFSICGAGETLAQPETLEIAREILNNGHFVNITTNGTIKKEFEKLKMWDKECLQRLHFSFSFHYLELKKKKMLDLFFENVSLIKELGCSFVVQLNLYDKYIECADEIKKICMENVGAYPQIAATRKETKKLEKVEIYTEKNINEYVAAGREFDSNLFEYTMKNFNKKRKEFCYAGDWSGVLDLSNGKLVKCYGHPIAQDIFKNPKEKINFEAIGNCCRSSFCMNSSHFMSLGTIVESGNETYCSLRNREEQNWFNEKTKEFLSHKLIENNREYSNRKKIYVNFKEKVLQILQKIKRFLRKIIKGD